MSQDFDSLNKQIASFIVLTSALAAPVYADGMMPFDTPAVSVQGMDMVVKYAGPGMMDFPSVAPQGPIDRYAGPVMPTPTPFEPSEPMIVRYAGPPEPQIQPVAFNPIDGTSADANGSVFAPVNNVNSVTELEYVEGYRANKIAPGHFIFD